MKIPILTLSSVLVEICKTPRVIFQNTIEVFFKFRFTFQCHERLLLCTFLGQTLYTLHEKDHSNCRFLRLLSAWIKIHQILVIFETANWFLFKFYITLHCRETQLLCTFSAEILYTFNKRSLSQCKFGEIKNLKVATLISSFHQNNMKVQLKSTEELSLMTLKSDKKFKEKLARSFKYDIRNLVSFHPIIQKSKTFSLMGYFAQHI